MELKLENRNLRDALGCFPTGVAVITAPDPPDLVGITANSFTSVSLDPPLVLWSLAKSAYSLSAFQSAGCFVVNVLSLEQHDLSSHFATRQMDKFAEVEVELNDDGAALFENCMARFQCRTVQTIDGGDHLIFVGQVVEFDFDSSNEALAFYRGQYSKVEPHPSFARGSSAK